MTKISKEDEFLKILEEIGEGEAHEGIEERLASDGRLLLEVVHTLDALQRGGGEPPELERPTTAPVALDPELLLRGAASQTAGKPSENAAGAPELEPPKPLSAEENAIRLARLLAETPPEL